MEERQRVLVLDHTFVAVAGVLFLQNMAQNAGSIVPQNNLEAMTLPLISFYLSVGGVISGLVLCSVLVRRLIH